MDGAHRGRRPVGVGLIGTALLAVSLLVAVSMVAVGVATAPAPPPVLALTWGLALTGAAGVAVAVSFLRGRPWSRWAVVALLGVGVLAQALAPGPAWDAFLGVGVALVVAWYLRQPEAAKWFEGR